MTDEFDGKMLGRVGRGHLVEDKFLKRTLRWHEQETCFSWKGAHDTSQSSLCRVDLQALELWRKHELWEQKQLAEALMMPWIRWIPFRQQPTAQRRGWSGTLSWSDLTARMLRKRWGVLLESPRSSAGQITKASTRGVNLETITATQSWYKILPLNGFNLIRAKQRLLRRRKRSYRSFSSRQKSQKSKTLTIHWIWANLVKICHHRTSTPHRSETNGSAERAVRRVKEGFSAVLLQSSGLDEKWWAEFVECCCFLRNVQDLLGDGKTPFERRYGEPFWGPILPLGAMVECYPISAQDQPRLHQFGMKISPGIAVRIWKGEILVADIEELENMDASDIYPPRINAREILTPQRWEIFIFQVGEGTAKLSGRDHKFREPNPRQEQPVGSEDLSGELQGEPESHQPTESKDDAEAWKDFWSIQGDFINRHHSEPRVQLYVPKEENIPNSTEIHWCDQSYLHKSGCVARTTCRWLLECGRESKFIRFLDRIHNVHIIARETSIRICGPGRDGQKCKQRPDKRMCGLM